MDILNDQSIFELKINEESKSHLSTISLWANINAIIGFVSLGTTILLSVLGKNTGTNFLGLVIIIGISLLLNITLFNAAKDLKLGVEGQEQWNFNSGLTKLATYFKIMGILFIVCIALVGIVVLVAVAFSGMKNF